MSNQQHAPEPFGFFKAEPFGWTDCAETDEGAKPLFDQAAIDAISKQRDELLAALEGAVDAFDHRNDSTKNLEKHRCSALVCARAAIAGVKGGAA